MTMIPTELTTQTSMATTRTEWSARGDNEPALMLCLQLSGSTAIEQAGRRSTLRAGEAGVLDLTRPAVTIDSPAARHHFLRIPRAKLALPDRVIREVAGARLDPANPVARLTLSYLTRLAERSSTGNDGGDQRAAELPGLQLIRATLAIHAGDDVARAPLPDALGRQLLQYARAHLPDPGLDAASIARAHSISVRQLYVVLARGDVRLGNWIRRERLEACLRDLARPDSGDLSITSIARRWGFADLSAFGRAFRTAYGLSPREWRQAHRPTAPVPVPTVR